MKSLLENGPKALALMSFSAVVVTMFHDWGYYWIIGSKFQSVRTPYDYIANSIAWLPLSLSIFAVYVFVAVAVGSFFARRRGEDADVMPNNSWARARIKLRFARVAMFGAVVTVIAAVSYYFLRSPFNVLFWCSHTPVSIFDDFFGTCPTLS